MPARTEKSCSTSKRRPGSESDGPQAGGRPRAERLLRTTSHVVSPSRLDLVMVLAGGCSCLTLGIVVGYRGDISPLGM